MDEFERIAAYFAPLARWSGALGLIDDAAQLADPGAATIITVDALVETVHFLPSDPMETVARKLVRVNVSDCLAKGARPGEALLTLGWPREREETELAAFAAALGEELDAWGAGLIGGDSVTTPGPAFFSLTLTGRCIGEAPVLRSGAQTGDEIWVTGEIGAGRVGLEAARAGGDPQLAARYRVPELPPMDAADLVAVHAHAALDVSDGLIGDLAKLAKASGVAAELDLANVPFCRPPGTLEEALDLATAGDDYQILFAAPPGAQPALSAWSEGSATRLSRIGEVRAGTGVTVRNQGAPVRLPPHLGFAHR